MSIYITVSKLKYLTCQAVGESYWSRQVTSVTSASASAYLKLQRIYFRIPYPWSTSMEKSRIEKRNTHRAEEIVICKHVVGSDWLEYIRARETS